MARQRYQETKQFLARQARIESFRAEMTPEQSAALDAYRIKYGVGWKARLLDDWRLGRDVNSLNGTGIDGAYLRQIRNQFGPSILTLI